MPSIVIDVRDFDLPQPVPAEGVILVRPILPSLGEDYVTTTQEALIDASVVTILELDQDYYYFIPRNLPGLTRWSFDLTAVSGELNLTDLIQDHQIDPTTLEPLTGAPQTVQEAIAELQAIVENGGASEEQIETAVGVYLTENPVIASDTEWGDDPKPTTVFQNGLA